MPAATDFNIDVSSDGDVSPRDIERAQEKLTRIADLVPDRVLHGQLRLSMAPSAAPAPTPVVPATVEGALDVDGQLVRAQVAAATMQEAVDRFADRLRSRLARFVGRRRARRDAASGAEADRSTDRPAYFDRPPDERQIVRRKSFAAPRSTPDEAVFDMEALDHDFFLFREAESGEANVVYRTAGGYELMGPAVRDGRADAGVEPIGLSTQVPPRIPLRDAITALNLSDERFLFFIDPDDGEGSVLYRRYDGHYGLITLEREG